VSAHSALRWLFALVAVGVLSAFALLLVTGQYHKDGPVLVALTEDRGLHRGDVFVFAGWAAGVLSLLGLMVARRR
jgi:hypothetical protein